MAPIKTGLPRQQPEMNSQESSITFICDLSPINVPPCFFVWNCDFQHFFNRKLTWNLNNEPRYFTFFPEKLCLTHRTCHFCRPSPLKTGVFCASKIPGLEISMVSCKLPAFQPSVFFVTGHFPHPSTNWLDYFLRGLNLRWCFGLDVVFYCFVLGNHENIFFFVHFLLCICGTMHGIILWFWWGWSLLLIRYIPPRCTWCPAGGHGVHRPSFPPATGTTPRNSTVPFCPTQLGWLKWPYTPGSN